MTKPTLTSLFFFFNDTATTEIYTLSLHDALPISQFTQLGDEPVLQNVIEGLAILRNFRDHLRTPPPRGADRKSTRLNSSHSQISYAVFCLKKKKEYQQPPPTPCTDSSLHATSRRP